MRRAVLLFAAVSMLASCKLRSLQNLVSFEGEIDMSITMSLGSLGSSAIKMEMKGDKARMEVAMGSVSAVSITDASQQKMWTLMPATHQYSEMDLGAAAAAAKARSHPKPKTSAHKTGRTDKVAGYDCDVYEIDDPSGALSHSEVCLASGLSMLSLGLSGPFAAFAKDDDTWGDLLTHGFPLRFVMRDASGAQTMTMEATHIERKKIADADFEIPAGYTKL
ncbi:MAG TPA: DUF4412 domain-containing protein [Polyangiaceae bacterium]|jgi:hypothetical protein